MFNRLDWDGGDCITGLACDEAGLLGDAAGIELALGELDDADGALATGTAGDEAGFGAAGDAGAACCFCWLAWDVACEAAAKGNWTLFSTGDGGNLLEADADLIKPPTDDDDAGEGGSNRSGTALDFCWGMESLKAESDMDEAPVPDAAGALAATADADEPSGDRAVTPWAAKSLSLSRPTVDEFVGQVALSLMVRPPRFTWSRSNFS